MTESTSTTNLVTYDEYVELFSDWQTKLLDLADKISVSGNVHIRIFWRNKLAREFKQFLTEVNEIELKTTSREMTPSINFEPSQKIKMNEENTPTDAIPIDTTRNPFVGTEFIQRTPDFSDVRRRLREEEEEKEDIETVDGGDDDDYDYDEEGSVDMLFDDLNVLRDEYQMFMRMTDREIDEEELPLLDEIIETLHGSFFTIRDAIIRRLQWTESQANDAIGWIDRPRTTIYLQNTGRQPVVRTDTEAVMLDSRNFNYGVMVPVRLFHEEGFTDYSITGRQI